MTITNEMLFKAMTPRGGYTRRQLILLGVEWPLVTGWKKRLIGTEIKPEVWDKVLETGAWTFKKAKEARKEAEKRNQLSLL